MGKNVGNLDISFRVGGGDSTLLSSLQATFTVSEHVVVIIGTNLT
jgi:Flp pilus assembly protein protease CpaA